jgi:hypothetical protein
MMCKPLYFTWEEHVLICTALTSGQDKGQCVIKPPLKPALFLDAPWWEEPFVSRRMLARADERIRANLPVEVLPPEGGMSARPAAIDGSSPPFRAVPAAAPPPLPAATSPASPRPNFWL